MKNFTHPRNTLFTSISLILLLGVFSSCSSSKNSHYSDDGIYGRTDSPEKEEVVMVRDTRSDYYQNYFAGEKEYHEEIFTDIDSYKGYQDSDTVYVDEGYVDGNPPWEYSNSKVTVNIGLGFGGGWGWGYGWGYPYYNWGWGYPGWAYGWNYPYYGWGWGAGWGWTYPGWGWGPGWGYPGWGWGPGWGYYPPYHGSYTYGKRYAHNTGRLNTRNIYNESSLSSRYNRSSSNFDRRVASNYSRGRYPSSADKSARSYDRSSRAGTSRSNPSYNRSANGKYDRSTNRGYNSRSYGRPSSGVRSSSGMSRGGGMSRSSGRRNMSYIDLDNTPYGSNKTFIKRGSTVKRASGDSRISYSKARSNPNYQRTVRTNPAVSGNSSGSYRSGTPGNIGRSSGRSSGNAYKSSGRSSGTYSRSSSGSSMRSSGGGSRSSAPSRSGGVGRSSSRNR